MNIRQLQVFTAIYEAGGISRAAQRERTAPSVISHHLANLEARSPQALFVRNARGLVPTEHGVRLYAHATAVLRALAAADEELRNMPDEIGGQIAIGMAHTAVRTIGVDLMRIVLQQYPKLSLTLSETVSGSTISQLMAARIDLALAYNPAQDPRLSILPLMEERMVCVGRKEVIGEGRDPITVDELLRLPFILLRKGVVGRSIMDSPRLQKLFEEHARLKTDNVNAVGLFLQEGLGCAITTKAYMREQPQAAALMYRTIIEPEILRTLHICTHADEPPSRAMAVLRQWVLRLIARAVHEGRWECERILAEELLTLIRDEQHADQGRTASSSG